MSEINSSGTESSLFEEVSSFLGVPVEKTQAMDSVIVSIIKTKIQDFNGLKSENVKLSVTIDEVKSISSKRTNSLKAEIENLMMDNDVIRSERSDLNSQIAELNTQTTMLSTELEKSRSESKDKSEQVELLKKDKRDIVKLLEEKIDELQNSTSECDRFLSDNRELRNKILQLENETQNLRSNELNDKAEIQTSRQKLDLLAKNNEWLEKEMNAKNEQLITLRHTSDAELQKTLKESSILKNDLHLEKTNKEVLINKNQELSKDLQEKFLEVKHLKDSLVAEKNEFQREMSLKQSLIGLLEKQIASLKEELRSSVEKGISNSNDSSENKSLYNEREKLIADLADLKLKLENSEHERLRLEALVNEFMPIEKENGHTETSAMISSTLGSDISSRKVYGDIGLLKRQLIKERHQKENLQRQVESFIIELEHKIPIINSFKKRTSMLEKELNDVALLLEHTSNEKERKDKEFEGISSKIKQYESNIHTLVRQRSDLAHQVQYLLLHVSIQNDKNGPLTEQEMAFVKKILNNEDPNISSDSQGVISERLLEFNNIIELQQKNSELLKTVRSFADKLEAQERSVSSDSNKIESETIKDAKEAIVTLQDYNTQLESRLKTTEKERDAYKVLLSDNQNKKTNSVSSGNGNYSKKTDDAERIRNLETNLSNVTGEYSKNMQLLNQEVQELYKIKSQVTSALEKEKSSKQLAEERLKLSQSTVELSKNENIELSKRYRYLQDIMASQDKRTSDTVTEYITCKTKLISVEAKLANIEAERDLLRTSEQSLKDDSRKLSDEKNTLRIMVTQLQTLQSEREAMLQDVQKAHKENIRDLQESYNKIQDELASKRAEIKVLESTSLSTIQRYHDKIDSLRDECNKIRDKLTEKTVLASQLESEAKGLKKELEESKVRISSFNVLNDIDTGATAEDNIRKELEKAKISLNDAYAQIDQYKELAATADESLNHSSEEFKQVKEDLCAQLESLKKEKSDLEAEVSTLNEHLENTNNELNIQSEQFNKEKNDLLKKLSILESNGQPLEELKKEYELKLAQLQKDLEEQAAYANKAQKNYEEELQKHADVSKAISELREQACNYKSVTENLRSAEAQAKKTLEDNENSWLEQRNDYESQLDLAKQRLEDLSTQNKLLYDQVELLSNRSDAPDGKNFHESSELLTSLRRERDILETKFIMSDREAKALLQKQKTMECELEEARSQIMKVKEEELNRKSFTDEHEKIMEQLNQLNLLRESNITLRNASLEANKKNTELLEEVEALQVQLLPLRSENESLRNTVLEKDQQISLYKSEADRWRQRSQEILRKQERIDPEEYEKLGSEVAALKVQLEERIKENTDLNDRFSRLKKQAHEKLNASKIAQTTLTSELSDLIDAKKKLEEVLKEEERKVRDLESNLAANSDQSTAVETLQNDLTDALTKSKEVESSLQSTLDSSNNLNKQLHEEILSLKNEISLLKEKEKMAPIPTTNEDISNVVESMKRVFEQEKIDFIQEKTNELNEKLKEDKAKAPSSNDTAESGAAYDLEELKKKWAEEYEEATLQRIEEAEENLKRRIRMPTEERINKIIEKRKSELEEEYQKKASTPVNGVPMTEEQLESLRKELEKELNDKFENDLKLAKKKSFEEGKQQASMKTTLLERKISKLETQLKEKENTADAKVDSQTNTTGHPSLSKIDESSRGAEKMTAQPPSTGEQVLKLVGAPTFNFQPNKMNNPFTSTFQNASPENHSVFGRQPCFTTSNTGDASPFGKLTTGFKDTAQKPAFCLAPEPEAELSKDGSNISESDKASSAESKTTSGPSSPLKRPTENEESDEAADRKKIKEDSAK